MLSFTSNFCQVHPVDFFINFMKSTSGNFLPNKSVRLYLDDEYQKKDRPFGIHSKIYINSSIFDVQLLGFYNDEYQSKALFELSISSDSLIFQRMYKLLSGSQDEKLGIFRIWPENKYSTEYTPKQIECLKLISGIQNENIIKSIFLSDNFWEIHQDVNNNKIFYLKSLQYHRSVVVLKIINRELHIDFIYNHNLNENI